MSIIAWIILGAIAGYLAGFLVTGDEGLGVIGHIVLGIVGALVGGFLACVLFISKRSPAGAGRAAASDPGPGAGRLAVPRDRRISGTPTRLGGRSVYP